MLYNPYNCKDTGEPMNTQTNAGIKEFIFTPSTFFYEKAKTGRYGFMPIILIVLAFLTDFAVKTVLFYKITINNVHLSSDWSAFGGGYFGQVIGYHAGTGLRFIILICAFYFIGRRITGKQSLAHLINLSGYCFVPWLIGCIVLVFVYSFGLEIGSVNFRGDFQDQLTTSLMNSPAYLGQRIVAFNAWVWTAILGAAVLAAYWKVKFFKSLSIMIATVIVVVGIDWAIGLALQHVEWIKL